MQNNRPTPIPQPSKGTPLKKGSGMTNNTFGTIMSVHAAASANEAREEASKAKDAAEEALEGKTSLILVNAYRYEDVAPWYKKKQLEKISLGKLSLKKTDISYAKIKNNEVVLVLEKRCDLPYNSIYITGTIEDFTKLYNLQ